MNPVAALFIVIVAIMLIYAIAVNIEAILALVALGIFGGLIIWGIKLIASGSWVGFIPIIVALLILFSKISSPPPPPPSEG